MFHLDVTTHSVAHSVLSDETNSSAPRLQVKLYPSTPSGNQSNQILPTYLLKSGH